MFYCFSYFVDIVEMVGTITGDDSRSLSMLPIVDMNQQLLQLLTGIRFGPMLCMQKL